MHTQEGGVARTRQIYKKGCFATTVNSLAVSYWCRALHMIFLWEFDTPLWLLYTKGYMWGYICCFFISAQCCILFSPQSFVLHCKSNDWFLCEIQHWVEMGWSSSIYNGNNFFWFILSDLLPEHDAGIGLVKHRYNSSPNYGSGFYWNMSKWKSKY